MREIRTYGLKGVLRKRSRRATAPEDYQCDTYSSSKTRSEETAVSLVIAVIDLAQGAVLNMSVLRA